MPPRFAVVGLYYIVCIHCNVYKCVCMRVFVCLCASIFAYLYVFVSVCFHPAFLIRCSLFFFLSHIITLYIYIYILCILCISFFVVLNGTAPVSGTLCMRITATLIDRGIAIRVCGSG